MSKYGCIRPSQNPQIKQKIVDTLKERYGEGYYASEEFQEKIKKTNMERLGYEYPSQSPKVKEKVKNTFMERYGGWYTKTEEYREKRKQTCLEKYGYEDPMLVPEIAQKQRESMLNSGKVPTSIQQIYLHQLYGGEINKPFNYYNLDIYMTKDNIDIEYSGGGHDLGVKLGRISPEQFKRKQIIRYNYLRNANIRLIEIITEHDLLPSDIKLLEMYDFAKHYFDTTNHTWIEFYPEENKYRNAEHQDSDGTFYDYGKLRKISKDDISMKEVENE